MSERLRNAFFATTIVVMAVALATVVVTSPSSTDRAAQIGERIKCPVCQGESIANSPSQMARDMMSLVQERVDAGADDGAIIDELLSSYSGAVLLDPPVSGSTLTLWLAPIIAVVVGGGVIAWWRRHPPTETNTATVPTRGRTLIGGLAFALVLVGIVVATGFSLQERDGPASGIANLDPTALEDVSNETMEAVIAANLGNPQIAGMRLALASRYIDDAEYGSALEHLLAVADSPSASSQQRVFALIQMGLLVWDANAEADLAISLFDRALELDPTSTVARYHKAVVAWCGHQDVDTAAALLSDILTMDAPPEVVEAATADLRAINAGEACR